MPKRQEEVPPLIVAPTLANRPPHPMHSPGVADQIMAVRRKDNAPGDADVADRAGARPTANAVVPVESPLLRPSHQLPPPFQITPGESVLIHRCVTRCSPPSVSAIRV